MALNVKISRERATNLYTLEIRYVLLRNRVRSEVNVLRRIFHGNFVRVHFSLGSKELARNTLLRSLTAEAIYMFLKMGLGL